VRFVSRLGAVEHGAEGGHDLIHVLGLRAQPHHVHAQAAQFVQCVNQRIDQRRLGLDPVDREKGLGFLGFQEQAIGIFHADVLAVVLGEIAVAGREAAGGKGQGHAAIGKDLGLQACGPVLLQLRQAGAAHFQRHDPADRALTGDHVQGRLAVDVQERPPHERTALHAVHGPHVVGFHGIAPVLGNLAQGIEIVARFQQDLGRQDGRLAGLGQHVGNLDPVGQAQFVTA
jgi:hypothetical protein